MTGFAGLQPQPATVRRRQPEQSAVGFEKAFEVDCARLAARGLTIPLRSSVVSIRAKPSSKRSEVFGVPSELVLDKSISIR